MKDCLIIEGGHPLNGRVRVSGAKNAGLVLLVASTLADGETILDNMPRIRDVEVMVQILNGLGVNARWNEDGSLSICPPPLGSMKVKTSYELSKKLRASNLLLGALLGREREAVISLPGGCDIGSRPMDLHIKGIQALGAEVDIEHGFIYARSKTPSGARVYLDFPSVGATENIMMMASRTPGQSVIENAAKEPEIVDLANFLNSMGARIRGAGTDLIKVEGVPELKACRYAIIPDRIEAGTYMVGAAISGGDVQVENVIPTHLHPIVAKLQETGAMVEETDQGVRVRAGRQVLPVDIKTLPYPGFPTDMQSQMMALLSLAEGSSVIVENVFENRFQIVDELKRMGASIQVEGHTAVVRGVKTLFGARVKATDLRAGAGLILGALAARGETTIENAIHIFRGYENIEEKLSQLGAQVKTK
ncbi:MAG: UDP-N-acetylglucosamine 1-carboxyvinyltransferase [Syntrophomonas sp.]|uniref:UDP-N-acetylglucosamine 1-carboxyvinyltransferase n=1 Tax=Syntrophomonas sp. TaxID=2053627 RepID=UPI002625BE75|nr:UDP-N-acetylglucosamine 1-carboxyvinyltransferase [Syntrophomonas sp.]MDD2511565.1 UDP-N-acetylglucosamine 1-carboxyvinyltransferase [Syntrophomonas sp.]MDD3879138.1 UDP-N-acetylglucosamine 1-carboxyvinyltransferase [Syntrophomonas sp.]MDD4625583.1 UDP-N-acetylglucosamine 1-carboxyvinyltransferase [Syntrophomonas sp.]